MTRKKQKSKFNKDVGIGITTFLRSTSLYRLIESIEEYLPNYKMYIVDQAKPTKFKEALYAGLKSQGHVIKYADYDCGISKARSVVHSIVEEPYIAWMQDDFIATDRTNLQSMLNVLKSDSKIGVVGGRLAGSDVAGSYSYYFLRWGDVILYLPVKYCLEKGVVKWQKTDSGNKYLPADIVSEFTIWRKEIPASVFDLNVKVLEHSHVYLNLKYDTDWLVVYTPDSEINHVHDRDDKEYNKMRGRTGDIEYILKYWNIKELIKFTDLGKYKFLLDKMNWHYHIPEKDKLLVSSSSPAIPAEMSPEKKKEVATALSQDNTTDVSMSMIDAETYEILNEFISHINKFEKNCYLSNKTCLEGIVKHRIQSQPLCLSIPKLSPHEFQLLANKGYIFDIHNYSFIKSGCIININHEIPRGFKTIRVNEFNYLTPMPVVRYLKNLYGPDWDKDNI